MPTGSSDGGASVDAAQAPSSPSAPPIDGGPGSAPDAAAPTAKQRVLAYLTRISGKGTVVGIEDKTSATPTSDSDTIASLTGKTPGFWSADWGFGSGAVDHRQTIVDEGIRQWRAGAIVQYIYHACPLTEDE